MTDLTPIKDVRTGVIKSRKEWRDGLAEDLVDSNMGSVETREALAVAEESLNLLLELRYMVVVGCDEVAYE